MYQPTFSQDWFSHNIVLWQQHVAPYLKSIDCPKVLEIGAFEGRSSVWLLENIQTLRLTVIDPWDFTANASNEIFNCFKSNISPYSDRVEILRGKSDLAKSLPSNEFDAIYIDGEHTSAAVLHDAVIGYELLKIGGLLIFDDYLGGDKSIMYPKPAVDFFQDAYAALHKVELISDGYQRIYKKLGGAVPPQF